MTDEIDVLPEQLNVVILGRLFGTAISYTLDDNMTLVTYQSFTPSEEFILKINNPDVANIIYDYEMGNIDFYDAKGNLLLSVDAVDFLQGTDKLKQDI